MVKTRVLSAVVGIPFAIAVVLLGGIPFTLTITALTLIGLWELSRSMAQKGWWVVKPVAAPILVAALAGVYLWHHSPTLLLRWLMLLWWLSVFGSLLFHVAYQRNGDAPPTPNWRLSSIAATVLSVSYLGLFVFLVLLRQWQMDFADRPYPLGRDLVFFMLVTVWVTDSVAFLFGRAFGKEPLAPQVSPGKTLEGSFAGTIAGFCAAWLFAWGLISFARSEATAQVWLTLAQPVPFSLLALALSTMGQLGDLSKSVIKRELGIKDFGSLIPGHGGVLDRFDSVLATAPLVYLYAHLLLR